jgi:hypothetical protein
MKAGDPRRQDDHQRDGVGTLALAGPARSSQPTDALRGCNFRSSEDATFVFQPR